MRSRFEQQYSIGQRLIEDTPVKAKHKDKLEELIAALKAIYCNPEYNQRLFGILEHHVLGGKKKTGRKGMDLWCIFVLSQVRLCLNTGYGWIHNLVNNHQPPYCQMVVGYPPHQTHLTRLDFCR